MGTPAHDRRPPTGDRTAKFGYLAYHLVKALALVVGAPVTLFALMALVGRLHPALWLRLPVGVCVGLLLPLYLASRVLPDALARQTRGLTSELVAVLWLGLALGFVGPAFPWTHGLIAAEAARLAAMTPPHLAGPVFRLFGYVPPASFPPAAAAPSASASPASSQDTVPTTQDVPAVPSSADVAEPAPPLASPAAVEMEPSDHAEGPELDPAQLVALLTPAVVTLAVRTPEASRATSGFFVRQDGTVLTTLHALRDVVGVATKLHDGRWIQGAEVLAQDPGFDLALLRIPVATPVAVVKLAEPKGSQSAWCAGNPVAIGLTLSEEQVDGERQGDRWLPLRLHDGACAHVPGGPLTTASGRVLGMVCDTDLLAAAAAGQPRPLRPGASGAPSPVIVALIHAAESPGRSVPGLDDTELW